MRFLVSNGRVVTAEGVHNLNVLCEDGVIAALLRPGEAVTADRTLDVSGMYVFPGFIDPHVHSRDPGLTEKEDFAHSTLGALVGGVTTIIEMPNAIPPVDNVQVFHERRAQHERSARVDFAMWAMSIGYANLDQLEHLFGAGVAAVKIFWGYALNRASRQLVYNIADEPPENLLPPPDHGAILQAFKNTAAANGLLAAHCEDREIVAACETALGHPIDSYADLLAARPAVAEATSIAIAAEFSRATGCAFHAVHVGSAAGVEAVRNARKRGIAVTGETCPQYLTLTEADFNEVGPIMKVYPPIRTQEDQDALWEAVNDGTITSIGSDHAPHTIAEKSRGLATQPAGIVGCETIGPVMTDALFRGKITPQRLADVMSTATARLYGLYPRKGAILPGSEADLTIVDPSAKRTIRNNELVAKQPISPWNGRTLHGVPFASVLRGELVMRSGAPVGTSAGRFVPADRG